MAVETFVLNAYSLIVSWTYFLLTVLIFVKIIQFFSGGSFLGGGTGGRGDRGDRGGNGRGDRGDRGTGSGGERGEGQGELGNTGNIKVVVQDISRNAIPEVLVKVYPRGNRGPSAFVRKFRLAVIKAHFNGRTDNNGIVDMGVLPAGEVIFELFKEGYTFARAGVMQVFSIMRTRKRYFWSKRILKADEDQMILFTMGREGEEAKGFEPFIESAEFRNNSKGEPVVHLRARID